MIHGARKEVDHGRRKRDTVVARASYHLLARLGRRLRASRQRPGRVPTLLDDGFRKTPELFPPNFAQGYELKDDRMSVKQGLPIRRILLKDGTAYSVRPSFLMPYMTARTEDVEGPLFLRKFGVPFWALAHVFGRDPMYWYRLECGLGRFSVVGTTVRQAEVPEHLLADEHHQPLDGQKVYIATTVGGGCCLGAEPAEAAGTDDLKAAYAVFKDEARDVDPRVRPQDRQHRRLEGDASGLEGAVPEGGHPPVLLARVAQDPRPGQAPEGAVRGGLAAGLGGVPCPRPPELRATVASAPGVGRPDTSAGIVLENVLDLCRKRRPVRRSRTVTPAATARATCSTARCAG